MSDDTREDVRADAHTVLDDARAVLDVEELRTLVAAALDLDVEEVTDHARFVEDLEVDSLISLEIVVRVEERFGVHIGEDEMQDIADFAGVRDLTQAKLRTGKAA